MKDNAKINHQDFIGTYEGVYPDGFCEHLIENFKHHKDYGVGGNRRKLDNCNALLKDDYSIFYDIRNQQIQPFKGEDPYMIYWDGLQQAFDMYKETYPILQDIPIRGSEIKMQEISSGGGYHIWHCENNGGKDISRCLVYLTYLNTIPEEANGETEFLYQQKRERPVENKMVIWPAQFTHPHRGNPVFGDHTKYIATGWFHYES